MAANSEDCLPMEIVVRMVRRIFQLPLDDARWLDAEAVRRHAAVAGLLREAVRRMREVSREPALRSHEAILEAKLPGLREAILNGDWNVTSEKPE